MYKVIEKILEIMLRIILKIFSFRRKFYFKDRHFCILFIGFDIYFIYKKFPKESKIYIFSEEI